MHQLAAVRGLRETRPPSVGMVNVLRRGMEDATIFCRVRGEAAMALALGAGTEHNGEHPQPCFALQCNTSCAPIVQVHSADRADVCRVLALRPSPCRAQ